MTRLHPGAWWLWALGLGVAASRTTNPLLLGLIIAVAGYVAVRCREQTPWAHSYGVFLKLGLVVIGIRVVFHILVGGIAGPTVLFTLPEVPLPAWAQGVRLGGPVTAEGLVFALEQGLQLATILACVGAANALANPKRLLRSLPAALYEVSVAVVVAMTLAPQLVTSARTVRRARLLRGNPGGNVIRTVLAPVLTDALDRSIELAAAMDSRGYGSSADTPRATRRWTAALLLTGLLGLCVGTYGLLGDAPPVLELPMLFGGALLAVIGLRLAARRVQRTRYRPDSWRGKEIVVAASAVVAAVVTVVDGTGLVPSTVPLTAPQLPLLAALAVLVALTPTLLVREADR